MDDEERVVELDLPWQPDAGAPHPVVRQDEARLVVVYRAAHPAVGPFVRLQFDSPLCSIFGYPNDEALAGHPLYEVGLGSYGLYEVLSSAWLRELRGRNLTCFPNSTWWPDPPH
ncbi:MAG TPA: hypothetical protein VK277_09465, partial [Acidimicrobiales bacterium]|nr:hypothetical protein [Acidimicrobiales bacterium]